MAVKLRYNAKHAEFKTVGGAYQNVLARHDGKRNVDAPEDPSSVGWIRCKESNNNKGPKIGKKEEQVRLSLMTPEDLDELIRLNELRQPGYYSSNHVLVNRERIRRRMDPLVRDLQLDEVARRQAEAAMESGKVKHSQAAPCGLVCRRLGENVACGKTIRAIHNDMMHSPSDKRNILDARYKRMGMGTARGEDGILYLCQIFQG
mmetsp:Transcript_1230/g.3174  ORF Transcript_1230/g.3174 Transcript_1230/m.3174 type:complete len:204 (-) Transcript_1230:110-721(-)|eukprot:CAMPEP_0116844068 /NCGR_PEP_ID=MMETSP0418-20121206/12457_1 /TAXON_ID=1158023 /ORGANISM="Astrosyne radiata, Strain 13vi08-1A" /LENGTH=203 /DNA_ID=CAMNT_0004474929 /DNA_START=99 /DNA_END=710 /DNA_ORIENTATION=+